MYIESKKSKVEDAKSEASLDALVEYFLLEEKEIAK
jgi:hypothetical protein